MKSWIYEVNDVLRIQRKGAEVLARVAGYVDQLDDTKPLYVNLRVAGGLRWSQGKVKVTPEQIIEALPNWYIEQKAAFDANLAAFAADQYAKMSQAEKDRLDERTKRRAARSPLDIMIDRACGIE